MKLYKSYAKINLFLDVIRKYKNNYHGIRSIFAEIDLYDEIKYEFNNLNKFRFFDNKKNKLKEDNLIVKAANGIIEAYGINQIKGIDFYLKKNIPIGGGLGGGSSNAASILKIINNNLKFNLSINNLKKIGSMMGADIPFFIEGGIQKVFGFGEITKKLNTSNLKLNILLLFPDKGVSTIKAYELIDNKNICKNEYINKKKYKKLVNALLKNEYGNIINNIYNKFENIVLSEFKSLKDIYDDMNKTNPDKIFMSGSGSTLVALYITDNMLLKAFNSLKAMGYSVHTANIRV